MLAHVHDPPDVVLHGRVEAVTALLFPAASVNVHIQTHDIIKTKKHRAWRILPLIILHYLSYDSIFRQCQVIKIVCNLHSVRKESAIPFRYSHYDRKPEIEFGLGSRGYYFLAPIKHVGSGPVYLHDVGSVRVLAGGVEACGAPRTLRLAASLIRHVLQLVTNTHTCNGN